MPTRTRSRLNITLFASVVGGAVVGLPAYAYFYGYSWVDWTMFVILYIITGLGITVGYHRLLAHRSFACPDWVKGSFLVAGGWALQNSGLRWTADHIRHHARCDQEGDPYSAKRGFWHSHCGWLFWADPHRDDRFARKLQQDAVVMWQHRYYIPIVLSGLAFPFVVGFFTTAGSGGWGVSCSPELGGPSSS